MHGLNLEGCRVPAMATIIGCRKKTENAPILSVRGIRGSGVVQL